MSAPATLIRTHSNSNSNMGIKDTRVRRRSRSTSIIHEVLPETVIDESDQSALPNWNSSWVNLKGETPTPRRLCFSLEYLEADVGWDFRSLGDTSDYDYLFENPVQLVTGSVARVVVDVDESHVHGFVVFDVSLGQGDPF